MKILFSVFLHIVAPSFAYCLVLVASYLAIVDLQLPFTLLVVATKIVSLDVFFPHLHFQGCRFDCLGPRLHHSKDDEVGVELTV